MRKNISRLRHSKITIACGSKTAVRRKPFFLHVDPNKSLYYVPDKGYVFDPYIELESTMSFSEEQYNLLGTTLGKEQNKIARSADLVIQASVGSITPTLAPNVQGVNLIYSDITFQVEDVLRNTVSSSDSRELQVGESFNLRFPGGDYNGVQLRVSSMPLFTQGEKVILYLQKNGNSYSVVRGHAGKVSITGSNPFTHRWEGTFPIVPFKVNPNLTGQNSWITNNQIDQARSSGNIWSFHNTKSHISFKFEGTTTGNSATTPTLACDFDTNKANIALEKKIYRGIAGNPDCTSESCSYVWICNGGAVHFDTEINSTQNSFDVISDSPATYNLQTVLNKELGRVAGLPPVATSTGSVTGQSTQMVLFRDSGLVKPVLPDGDINSIRAYYGSLTPEEGALHAEMQSFADKATAYCTAPCVTPDKETNSKYALSGDDAAAIQLYWQELSEEGKNNKDWLLVKYKWIQDSYTTAYSYNGKSAEYYMLDTIEQFQYYQSGGIEDHYKLERILLSVQISIRQRLLDDAKYELDSTFYKFIENEQKILIQLRRMFIDAL